MSDLLAKHSPFMHKALALALEGQYTARPNPLVGCVLVQGRPEKGELTVIGQGSHSYPGGPHAEVVALSDAKSRGLSTIGAVAYLNLAPCCHVGKTPPCVDALIEAKVSEVVYAIEDPNPISSPTLAETLLRKAGIKVTTGVLAEQARKINRGFISRMQRQRPFVRAKVALSLDGNMALKNHQSQWITSEAARTHSQHFRASSGAIITGMGTVIFDNPKLTVRQERFVMLENFKQPVSVIIGSNDSIKEIKSEKQIFQKSDTLIFDEALPRVLNILATEHEINDVLLESGPGLLNHFLSENLIDELIIYLAPKLLGKDAMNISQFGPLEKLTQSKDWVFQQVEQVGEDIMILAAPKEIR